jgi:uncharacterized delta-60 repeat protein
MKLHKLFSHRVLGLIISILMFASFLFAAAGDVDTSFLPSLKQNIDISGSGLAIQPDGKILSFGSYSNNGVSKLFFTRFNTDLTEDATFNCPACLGAGGSVIIQPDGKILIGGSRPGNNSSGVESIKRVNPDGTLDSSFNYTSSTSTECSFGCFSILYNIQSDGRFYALKYIAGFNGSLTQQFLNRYNSDGSIDNSFAALGLFGRTQGLNQVSVLSNGKIMVSGQQANGILFRLNSNGTKDTSFESPIITYSAIIFSPYLHNFIIKPNEKIITGGYFDSINGLSEYQSIARLNNDGSVDLNYSPYIRTSNDQGARFMKVLSNGKYIVKFVATSLGVSKFVRFNSDDTVDNTFTPITVPAPAIYDSFLVDNQDRVVTPRFRLNYDGTLDTSFNLQPKVSGTVSKIVRQSDGKVIVSGSFTESNSTARTRLARLNTDGTTDTAFSTGTGFNADPTVITTQADGKILAGGTFTTFNGVSKSYLARLNSDGGLDNSFNAMLDGSVSSILPLSNGKMLIGGDFSAFNGVARPKLARLNSDGTIDSTFSASANGTVYSIIQQSDGKFMVGGNFNAIGGFARTHIARLNSDGSVDSTFNAGASFAIGFSIIQQPNGKYLVHAAYPSKIVRLNSDGSLDTGFANIEIVNGSSSVTPFINSMYLQSDGLIVIGGRFDSINGTPRKNIARLKPDGTLDAAYVTEGADEQINAMVAQPDGKLFVGGNFSSIGGVARTGLARINNIALIGARPLFDFDGDGKADVSVYRASTNTWYRILSGNSSLLQNNFGIANDIPVPADFDGDGKTDLAIFRPSTGTFWYQSSINNAQIATQWGQSGDIPRPSDFDGDGKADFIIFRPAENNWYRLGSTGQVSNKGFGAVGDKPVIGDFDGDGKSDVAIFRPSSGTWWYQASINNAQIATQFGISTDVPSPADFDGDGKTDFAVFRPSTGVWYVLNSSTGSATIVQFGIAEDKPVAADYDGDGKADIAVFRPSSGLWYLLRSTSGFSALQFGVSSDVALPNSFVP